MRVGVAQMFGRKTLEASRDQVVVMVGDVARRGCDVAVFPENILEDKAGTATEADFEWAVASVMASAKDNAINIVFGVRSEVPDLSYNRAIVAGRNGRELLNYRKTNEVPEAVSIDGVPCTVAICSDRWFLEHADLACVTQGTQVMIDISGGHGGDDGRPNMRFVRYPCWAIRNSAFVVVCNPPHDEPDYMGNPVWGGHSAIIDPQGRFLAKAHYEHDHILVADFDPCEATRRNAERRRNHPAFATWWEKGGQVLEGKEIEPVEIARRVCPERELTLAVAQVACSSDIEANVARVGEALGEASGKGADLVVFPALTLSGGRGDAAGAGSQQDLVGALVAVQAHAAKCGISAIVGTPTRANGSVMNSAVVIGPDGGIATRYDQVSAEEAGPFSPGTGASAAWFEVEGVPGVVTIGDDLFWPELTELSAYAGMQFAVHLDYFEGDEAARLVRAQSAINHLSAGVFGLYVNAADPGDAAAPGEWATGGSMLLRRMGGHEQPIPEGIETYLPYHTSVVRTLGRKSEIACFTVKTEPANDRPNRRNGVRRRGRGGHENWWRWMAYGARSVMGGWGAISNLKTQNAN